MKLAIAKEGNMVSGHFGHCEGFEIFEYDIQKDVNSIREHSFITKAFFKFNQNVFYNKANKELLDKVNFFLILIKF